METIADLIYKASQQLVNIASARLDCEVLLAELLQQDRCFIYAHPEFQPTGKIIADYQRMIAARQRGLPIAYLTGKKEFLSLPFKVNRATLIPRPETEVLVETALAIIPTASNGNLLDLCTGSGIIAISIGQSRPGLDVIASDISTAALVMAAQNRHHLAVHNVSMVQSDLFAGLAGREFHYITANPPYIRSDDPCLATAELCHEPRLALDGGHHGLDCLFAIIKQARQHLHTGGVLLLEHGSTQAGSVRACMRRYQYTHIQTIDDYAGHERVTTGKQ